MGFSLRISILFLSALLLVTVCALDQVEEVKLDPDVGKSTVELIEAHGYVAETHNVTTADGYILTLHRLPKSYNESQSESRLRTGYDVWLGNNRGNTYSTGHVKYTTEDDAFWDFSWEDMGRFDLPAMLNYARQTSGQKTVALVGHSEGTTQAFVAFSGDQTLAQSVSYFAALAPVAWLGTLRPKHSSSWPYLDKLFDVFGQVEFLSHTKVLQEVIEAAACTWNPELCETALALVSGVSESWNSSRVGVYLSEMPAGTSVKNMGHYAQSIRKNTFSAFNYGCGCLRVLGIKLCSKHICENKVKYGTFNPPAFPISRMTYPRTGFFTGENDILATSTDINLLRAAMPTTTIIHDEEISDFSHMDFTWAVDANQRVYQSVLEQLELYIGTGY